MRAGESGPHGDRCGHRSGSRSGADADGPGAARHRAGLKWLSGRQLIELLRAQPAHMLHPDRRVGRRRRGFRGIPVLVRPVTARRYSRSSIVICRASHPPGADQSEQASADPSRPLPSAPLPPPMSVVVCGPGPGIPRGVGAPADFSASSRQYWSSSSPSNRLPASESPCGVRRAPSAGPRPWRARPRCVLASPSPSSSRRR